MSLLNRCVVAIWLSAAILCAHASGNPGQNTKPVLTVPAGQSGHVVFTPPGRLDIEPGRSRGNSGVRMAFGLAGLDPRGRRSGGPADAFFFSQAVNYLPGNALSLSIALADVNGDGNLDVIVANEDQSHALGAVSVLLGNGDGTLQPPVNYDSGAPGATSVYVADLNGDGLPDIILSNQGGGSNGNGSVSVLLNGVNGNPPGTFQLMPLNDSGGPIANSVFVADVNGDGLPDIIVANEGPQGSNGSVRVLLNGVNGHPPGTFQVSQTFDSAGVDATAVALTDVNGDGFPDILVANNCFGVNNCPQQQGGVSVFLNDQTGNFSLFNSYPTAGPTTSIAIGDANGDGIADVLVGCGGEGAGFLPGQGGGNFGTYQAVPGVVGQVISVAIQDVNGDGINDVLVGLGFCPMCSDGNDSGVTVLLGTGGGNYQSPVTYDSGGQLVDSIGLGVMNQNGNGQPDLVVPNSCDSGNVDFNCGGSVAVFLNSVNGLTTTLTTSTNPLIVGYTVTYTATVTNPNGPAPTGNVTFQDNANLVATVPVTGNQAVFSTTYSAAGTHQIAAVYSLNNASQVSNVVTETVIKAKAPTVTTLPAGSITAAGAVLNGTINPQYVPGYAGFYWGTDPTLNSFTASCTFGTNCPQVATNAISQPFSAALSGLASSSTYYARIVFWYTDKNGNQQFKFGAIKSIKTKAPSVTTAVASSVTAIGAVVGGTINPASAPGFAGFYWGTDPTLATFNSTCTFGTDCPAVTPNSTTQSFTSSLTGLTSGTIYYFRIVFFDSNNVGANQYQYGAIKSFTTQAPTVTTSAATLPLANGATLNGKINPDQAPGYAGFYWGTDPALGTYTASCTFGTDCPAVMANSTAQSFKYLLSGLASNTKYYFRMVFYDTADNSFHYGTILSFTTKVPTVTTSAASVITTSGATLNGTINPMGAPGYVGFNWGTDPALATSTATCTFGVTCPAVAANSKAQKFKSPITGLTSGTVYYFQVVFNDTDETGPGALHYGAILMFTTK